MPLEIENWGLVDYQLALDRQQETHARVISGGPDTLIFCTHPPVVTLGRKTEPGDLQGWTGATIEIARGGRATYHGPSQLVCYPILNLANPDLERTKDIGWYLRILEAAMVQLLRDYGIESEGRAMQKPELTNENSAMTETGVWIGSKKIASVGIGIRGWVTLHGAALNLDDDPTAFQGLRPCGFESSVMTNVQKLIGKTIDRNEAISKWAMHLGNLLFTKSVK